MNTEKQKVLVIGANGSTGKIISNLLQNSATYHPIAMIRKESQAKYFENKGIETVLGDLEKDFEPAYKGVSKVIFAAGSGGSTGPEKTKAVDQEGAIKSVDFAKKHNIEKFVLLSSMGAGNPEDFKDSDMYGYLLAKHNADNHLMKSDLNYSIVRPGSLTNDKGTGEIEAAKKIGKRGKIAREDVAETLVEVLDSQLASVISFEILEGQDRIKDALSKL
ncbi:SDR family oxidoreductase [Algoriphagus aquimarinus]|uniref:SDR family oxidoreductase n=1 Tax=Algoriphagus aquimarinus TaxID=237018 RepID=UPI0030D92C9F|tara:strand:+ start:11072 stop:11728 length:657 start_codon:yes stop_codon:yes gene_type:complete